MPMGTRKVKLSNGKTATLQKPGACDAYLLLELAKKTYSLWSSVPADGEVNSEELITEFLTGAKDNLSSLFQVITEFSDITDEDLKARGDEAIGISDIVAIVRSFWDLLAIDDDLKKTVASATTKRKVSPKKR